MKLRIFHLFFIFIFLIQYLPAASRVSSPDGRLIIEIGTMSFTHPVPAGNWLYYQITYNNRTIVQPSPVQLLLQNIVPLGGNMEITASDLRNVNEFTETVIGKSKQLIDHCNELQLQLQERDSPGRKMRLTARAYNEAVAFRLHLFQENESAGEMNLVQEHTHIRSMPGTVYALRLKNFQTPYENNYEIIKTEKLNRERPIALPLLIHLDSGPWLAITEADLTDYPGMYLYPSPVEKHSLVSHLAPLRNDTTLSARLNAPRDLPWRVFMVADHPGKLIESNVILNLSRSSKIEESSWIKPGKTAWDWWSDRVVEGRSFKGGMNTPTMKYYIDFAAHAGLEYMLIDAEWYGKHDTPHEDITTTIPEINLPEILEHARSRNVGIWLWLNWQCVRDQMDKAFPLYESWGIKGVKVDYMNCDDQDMVNFYETVCRNAARHHLMVNFHGAYKPTGLRRTYPNLVTREGVLGLEWSKWSEKCNPDHELILPYTRMLAGPMDFTPGAFQVAGRKDFKARFTAPMAMGTRARQLAMYVVYESPVQMLVDHPASYFAQTGLEFLRVVPASWDETRFLQGEVGDYIVIARRHGREWYVGAMTDWSPRNLKISLQFLGEGLYRAEIYQDSRRVPEDPSRVEAVLQEVSAGSQLEISLVSGGGCAVRLLPTWAP